MNYKGVIFLVIISIVLGCKFQNDTNITKIKLEATNLNIEKWISKSTKGYLYGHRFFQIEDTDLLYYFSMLDTSIYIETFKEERLKKSFSIKFCICMNFSDSICPLHFSISNTTLMIKKLRSNFHWPLL